MEGAGRKALSRSLKAALEGPVYSVVELRLNSASAETPKAIRDPTPRDRPPKVHELVTKEPHPLQGLGLLESPAKRWLAADEVVSHEAPRRIERDVLRSPATCQDVAAQVPVPGPRGFSIGDV